MNLQSVQTRIVALSGLCLVATVAVVVGYAAVSTRTTATETAKVQVLGAAHTEAAAVQGRIDGALDAARTLAQTLSAVHDEEVALDIDREAVKGVLRIVLQENPNYLATFTGWEPDAFDDMDIAFKNSEGSDESGRFVAIWNRAADGAITLGSLQGYEDTTDDDRGGRVGDYYLRARETGIEQILEPRLRDLGSGPEPTVRVVVPIVSNGAFKGIAGVEIGLGFLQERAEAFNLFNGTGEVAVISTGGIVAGKSGDSGAIGTTWTVDRSATEGRADDDGLHLAENEEIVFVNGELRCITPIEIGRTESPWTLCVRVPEVEIMRAATGLVWSEIWITTIATGAALAVLWFACGTVVRPIRRTAEILKDIAEGEGDLTKRIDITRRDELGELAHWFNCFVEKLQGIIGEITTTSSGLATTSTDLARTSEELTAGAESAKAESAAVSEVARTMSTNLGDMAGACNEMSENVTNVSTSITELTQSIDEIARSAEEASSGVATAARLADDSNEKIGELGMAADEIGEVTQVIQDIAEQTNLLALNATIEAARAGEAGKGFAVVATEVKELASQTTSAIDDIRNRIERIQTSTGASVASMGEIAGAIGRVSEVSRTIASAVEEQSITAREVASRLADASSAAQLVSSGVNDSAASSHQITERIAQVDEEARKTANGASATDGAGRQLATLSSELNRLVGQFKV